MAKRKCKRNWPPAEAIAHFVKGGWPQEEAERLFSSPPAGPDGIWPCRLQMGLVSRMLLGRMSSHPRVDEPTHWQEANAMVAYALRNGPLLEGLHATCDEFGDAEMRALMIFTTRRLAYLLWAKEHLPHTYREFLANYLKLEPGRWLTSDDAAEQFVVLDHEKDPIDTRPDELITEAGRKHWPRP